MLTLLVLLAILAESTNHLSAAAPASGRPDGQVQVEHGYTGSDCQGKPLQKMYRIKASQVSCNLDNGTCRNWGPSVTLHDNYRWSGTSKCEDLSDRDWDKGEPGYLCQALYDAEECKIDKIRLVECWTMDNLGKCYPFPMRKKITPVPESAGSQANGMRVSNSEPGDDSKTYDTCTHYTQDLTNGKCFTTTSGRTGETVAWKAVW